MGLRKLFKPEIFQGNLLKKNYFEGWYFKHSSANLDQVLSVIPGIALSDSDSHAFIQVINGVSGETIYIPYALDTFQWNSKKLEICIGASYFSDRHIELDIDRENLHLQGRLDYDGIVGYPKSLKAPGIMGWYAYVPFMECNHGIVSATHSIDGKLLYNGDSIDFTNGKGYIEKDWGASFPEAWIWVQCNNFPTHDASLFISIAKIPWLGKFFMGLIAFLYFGGRFYTFSTYNRSEIKKVVYDGTTLDIELAHKKFQLHTRVTQRNAYELHAPATGEMSRRIKESIDSEVWVALRDNNGTLLFEETGQRAGLEIIDKIFEYL